MTKEQITDNYRVKIDYKFKPSEEEAAYELLSNVIGGMQDGDSDIDQPN